MGRKSLQESGKRGEPFLAGNGFARIGEGSGSPTSSPVPASTKPGPPARNSPSGRRTAAQGKPFTRENLEATYVTRRRASRMDRECLIAENARDGFHRGVVTGSIGMALAGLTNGRSPSRRNRAERQQIGRTTTITPPPVLCEIAEIRRSRNQKYPAARRADERAAAGPKLTSTDNCSSLIRTLYLSVARFRPRADSPTTWSS